MFFTPSLVMSARHEQAIWVLKKKNISVLFLILRHVLVYVLSSEKAVTKQVLVLGVGCCVAVGLLSFSPHHHHSPPQSGWVGEAMVNIDH